MNVSDELVERWTIEQFQEIGFSWEDAHILLAWRVDHHEARKLMFRDGTRTACTPEQALRILQPDEDVVIMSVPEPALT